MGLGERGAGHYYFIMRGHDSHAAQQTARGPDDGVSELPDEQYAAPHVSTAPWGGFADGAVRIAELSTVARQGDMTLPRCGYWMVTRHDRDRCAVASLGGLKIARDEIPGRPSRIN